VSLLHVLLCNFRLPESFTMLDNLMHVFLNDISLTGLPVDIGGFVSWFLTSFLISVVGNLQQFCYYDKSPHSL